jgi:RNA polymerase sigma-70 factor (ECF subfamily)
VTPADQAPADGAPTADEAFARERPRLLGLAYRVLGTYGDAEDVVQEAWLRWSAVDHATVRQPAAYLTTVVTRLAIDRLRSAVRGRARYVGPWLPEPVSLEPGPEDHAEMAESLTLGFLVLLDRLGPTERAVWLLADVFDEPFSLIAEAVGKTEAACRQIASRARRRLREQRPERGARLEHDLLGRLLGAVAAGDVQQALELLDADVVLLSDGGPEHHAARRPVVGAARVVRFAINVAKRRPVTSVEMTDVNGSPAVVLDAGGMTIVVTGEQHEGRVTRLYFLLNPDKLHALRSAPARMQ